MFVTVIGAVFITAVLLYATWWVFGNFYFQVGMAGFDSMDKWDWLIFAGLVVFLIGSWSVWWQGVGSQIGITFG